MRADDDDQFHELRDRIAALEADMQSLQSLHLHRMQRRTLGYFRDVLGGIVHHFRKKSGDELTVEKARPFFPVAGANRSIQSMSTLDWVTIVKLYDVGRGSPHPPRRTTYTSLRRFLDEREEIQVELHVGEPVDMKPFLMKVIEWAEYLGIRYDLYASPRCFRLRRCMPIFN